MCACVSAFVVHMHVKNFNFSKKPGKTPFKSYSTGTFSFFLEPGESQCCDLQLKCPSERPPVPGALSPGRLSPWDTAP